ncbi:MAG TPA: amidase [Fimbriiglobus sp.]|jgi:Asp-tRNA(Asn)/Glu-tRNA(Gln) amidotransferase A subunit family amidase
MYNDRRTLFRSLAALGIGGTTFQRALASEITQQPRASAVTAEMVKNAEWIAGITLSDDERAMVARRMGGIVSGFAAIRKQPLTNDVSPALTFIPLAAPVPPGTPRGTVEAISAPIPSKPDSSDELAFLPLTSLASLVRTKKVSSYDLTKLYLDRLKKYDPKLLCVVSLTEELAMKQAKRADAEIAAGKYRGPLHGIPWGAKDLIAVPGYKTTWGAEHYKDQTFDVTATVAKKLEAAGAVLVAKLTLGALAMGDRWFGGQTRSPWDPKQGSSGSSAGPASASAAGLVGFAIGTETRGSIVSPCRQCHVSGLRPTFGRISRYGCMALSWSMDKLGPIARSLEDCALVFGAIHGADGKDLAAVDRPFSWPAAKPLKDVKVGVFDNTPKAELDVLKTLGVQTVPVKLPAGFPIQAIGVTLDVECSAAFDELSVHGIKEGYGTGWPSTFRTAQFVSAVQYVQAQRARTLLMRAMETMLEKVDCYIGGGNLELSLTNLTGHPTIVCPNGFRKQTRGGVETEVPLAVTFTGRLYGETDLLAVGHAYQQVTGHHLKRPKL